jgi:hypothetical protein
LALVLDATPGGANSNAYADVVEADDELSYRVGGEAWADETPDQKIQALVTAASMIDALPLIGSPSDSDQSMQFPRDGDAEIPQEVWKANIVLALDLARKRQAGQVDVTNPVVSNVSRARSGDDEVSFFSPRTEVLDPSSLAALPLEVQRLLYYWILEPALVAWGSAPVVRTS